MADMIHMIHTVATLLQALLHSMIWKVNVFSTRKHKIQPVMALLDLLINVYFNYDPASCAMDSFGISCAENSASDTTRLALKLRENSVHLILQYAFCRSA